MWPIGNRLGKDRVAVISQTIEFLTPEITQAGPAWQMSLWPEIVVINLVSMTCCYRCNDDHSPVLADTDHPSQGE